MALNTWWDSDPSERYWMEIATGEIGKALQAPKFPGASWSYELVSQVRPGDRVLHWRSGADRGLAGWSEVTGEVTAIPSYTWQPRGTSGRALKGPRTTEGWVAPLGGLNAFDPPIKADAVQALRAQILRLRSSLTKSHGKSTYFPFYKYDSTHLRAQQGYVVKFPAALLDIIPGLGVVSTGVTPDPLDDLPEDGQPRKKRAPRGRVTRVQDPVLRIAIEKHAVKAAKAHYVTLGAMEKEIQELGKPYDLQVPLHGRERHVEVKGSSMLIDTVELTINEVTHGKTHAPTDLVVVDGIEWKRRKDGSVSTRGGNLRRWPDWEPADSDLAPRKFAYNLPPLA